MLALSFLLGAHIALCCVSLALIAPHHFQFHILLHLVLLNDDCAVAHCRAFSVVAYVFTVAPFTSATLLGSISNNTCRRLSLLKIMFSDLATDHPGLGALSAAAASIAILAGRRCFITAPVSSIQSFAHAFLTGFCPSHPAPAQFAVAISATYASMTFRGHR